MIIKIEQIRKELNFLIKNNENFEKILVTSQKLDGLISTYYKLINK